MPLRKAVHSLIYDMLTSMRMTELPKTWSHSKLSRQSKGQQSISFSTIPDFGYVTAVLAQRSPAAQALKEALNSNARYNQIMDELRNDQPQKFWMRSDMLAVFLIRSHLSQHTRLFPNKQLVDEIAENFSHCIENRIFGVRFCSPLEGFASTLKHIGLGPGLEIKRHTPNEMLRIFPLKSTDQVPTFHVWEHAIEYEAEHSIVDPPNGWMDKAADMKRVVHALRLLKPGKIAAPIVKNLPLKPGFIMFQSGTSVPFYKDYIHTVTYRLLPSEQPTLRDLFVALGGQIPKAANIAANRVDLSIERRTREDEFIDHVVALEALFGDPDNTTGAITYKIALRAAMFMHSTAAARTRTFQLIKKALGLRGKVVHGSSTLHNLKDTEKEAVEWLSGFIRKAIADILLNHPAYNQSSGDSHIFSLRLPT